MILRTALLCLGLAMLTACESPREANETQGEAHRDHDDPPTETRIAAAVAEDAEIRVAPVGPGRIVDAHEVQGLLTPIEGRHARLVARFPGPVRRVHVGVGDRVVAGQTLVTIESNLSLTSYSIVAPFAGTVLALNVSTGDLAADAPLVEVADLSSLWVDLHVFGVDAQRLQAGLPVHVIRLSDGVTADTRIDRILPSVASASQSTIARASLGNADGQWRPGAAVRAQVTVAERDAALVIPVAALQRMRGQDVVFVREGEIYRMQAVTLGERDDERVEVLTGLTFGQEVVIEQSYLLKAELEKSSAEEED